MTNATTSKGWDMSGTNAELISRARMRIDPHRVMGHAEEMAFALGYEAALKAAALTSVEDQMYIRRMEAERDAALAAGEAEPKGMGAAVEAFTLAWGAKLQEVGVGGAPSGTKTRAGLTAAFRAAGLENLARSRHEVEHAAFERAAVSAETYVKAAGHCSGCDMALLIAADIRRLRFE